MFWPPYRKKGILNTYSVIFDAEFIALKTNLCHFRLMSRMKMHKVESNPVGYVMVQFRLKYLRNLERKF